MKLSSQRLNSAKADGIWHETAIDGELVKFKIASQKSRAYQNALLKLVDEAKLRDKIGNKTDLTQQLESQKAKATRLFAEHILLDWQGITDDKGKAIPYSVELAAELVDENVYPLIADFVIRKSQETELYMGEIVKDDIEAAKNA